MALKATIFKAELGIADMERNYYGSHSLTLARHPSETDERMMVRLLAFSLNAEEGLAFGKGLSADDEPALWRINLDGTIAAWIDVGLPDERELRKACGRAQQVVLYVYGGRTADLWWSQNAGKLARLDNLSVIALPSEATQALAALANRSMKLDCTVQDSQVWLSDGSTTVHLEPLILKK